MNHIIKGVKKMSNETTLLECPICKNHITEREIDLFDYSACNTSQHNIHRHAKCAVSVCNQLHTNFTRCPTCNGRLFDHATPCVTGTEEAAASDEHKNIYSEGWRIVDSEYRKYLVERSVWFTLFADLLFSVFVGVILGAKHDSAVLVVIACIAGFLTFFTGILNFGLPDQWVLFTLDETLYTLIKSYYEIFKNRTRRPEFAINTNTIYIRVLVFCLLLFVGVYIEPIEFKIVLITMSMLLLMYEGYAWTIVMITPRPGTVHLMMRVLVNFMSAVDYANHKMDELTLIAYPKTNETSTSTTSTLKPHMTEDRQRAILNYTKFETSRDAISSICIKFEGVLCDKSWSYEPDFAKSKIIDV